jgi:hypothetical protein
LLKPIDVSSLLYMRSNDAPPYSPNDTKGLVQVREGYRLVASNARETY